MTFSMLVNSPDRLGDDVVFIDMVVCLNCHRLDSMYTNINILLECFLASSDAEVFNACEVLSLKVSRLRKVAKCTFRKLMYV
jgi:hypothetical protein